MASPLERNRAGEATSPYLQTFATQQVNWQPWDEQTLAGASERDCPLFLLLGYGTCHWCHGPASAQFTDEALRSTLDEHFVPVVVDCLVRPDLDLIYQTRSQQVHGCSGWPLAVCATPDGRPFHVQPALAPAQADDFPDLHTRLTALGEIWKNPEGRRRLEQRATEWTATLRESLECVPKPSAPDEHTLSAGANAAVRRADRTNGGWGRSSKFPHTGRIRLLLRAYDRSERTVYRDVATQTLDAMIGGGLYDHVGGGFHRYTTDPTWRTPSFEKLLSTNAELACLYLSAAEQIDETDYATVARETLAFVQRELAHEAGGFVSGLSAQSEDDAGEMRDGAFYVWTPAEVHRAIGGDDSGIFSTAAVDERDAELFCERYGVTDDGTVAGASVLTRERSLDQLARLHDMTRTQVEAALDNAHRHVAGAREQRPRPPRDEQVLAGWNGLALSAFAAAEDALDETYEEVATDAISFLREQLWEESTNTLSRRYCNGTTGPDGFLSDYAFLSRGVFEWYQVTDEKTHLDFALELARTLVREFWDQKKRTLYCTPHTQQPVVRPQERTDHSTRSSLAAAVELLADLSSLSDDTFAERANTVVETHGSHLRTSPLQCASLVVAADTVRSRPGS